MLELVGKVASAVRVVAKTGELVGKGASAVRVVAKTGELDGLGRDVAVSFTGQTVV